MLGSRERVHGDASEFVPFCREHSIRPAITQLEPICSFITPDMEHDRLPKGGFDARFFLACSLFSRSFSAVYFIMSECSFFGHFFHNSYGVALMFRSGLV